MTALMQTETYRGMSLHFESGLVSNVILILWSVRLCLVVKTKKTCRYKRVLDYIKIRNPFKALEDHLV